MTIRLKVRILLLVSVSLTVFYIVSHIYRLNSWFSDKNLVLKEDQLTPDEQYETALHSTSNYIQLNATTNSLEPSTVHTKIETFKPPYNGLPSEYKFNYRDRHPQNWSAKYTNLQTENTYPKYIQDTAESIQNTAEIPVVERETSKKSPTNKVNILRRVTQNPTNTSDTKTRPDILIIPEYPTLDNPIGDDVESGDIEEGKPNGKNSESGSNDDDENSEINIEILPTSKTSVSSATSSKIYFERSKDSLNATTTVVQKEKKPERTATILSTNIVPAATCVEHEGIDEERPTMKSKCNLYSDNLDTCTESAKYYNKENLGNSVDCMQRKYPPICYFANSSRTDSISKLHLTCNHSVCHNNEVRVGILNATSGKVSYMFLNNLNIVIKTLEQEIGYDTKEHGADFIFLSCKLRNKKRRVHQILPFPPLILRSKRKPKRKESSEKVTDKYNVNIVVLDSLSRKHLYRTLSKTVDAMKAINNDKTNPNNILDFKGFQSLAPFTYVNLQALLTGSVDFDSINTRRYNFEDLFSVFKTSGYQTLLQEDTCWHDEWGSILTGNRKLEKQDPHYHTKIWNEIRNLTLHHGIDSFGLTHMSCDVLANFGVTNLYNSNTMVCLNGEPLSSYFLEHILDNIITRTLTREAMPLLSYTHINIAHESSGTRIIGLDRHLAHFISVLGMTSNTLTIFLSDHGGKTSEYFMDTLTGRFEVYDPFLFVMIPKKLGEIVGKRNLQDLVNNQNSLLDVIDLRSMLINLNTILKNKKEAEHVSLFTESTKQRKDCQHTSIRNYALCKCFNNVTFPNKEDDRYKEFLIWLGEFAVGYLNNKLTNQQLTTTTGHRCSRIRANNDGNNIKNIVERRSSRGVIYLFDILTKIDDSVDVFNFQVLFNDKRNEKLELLQVEHWIRISIYSRYASCKDKNVSYEICICSDDYREKIDARYLTDYKQFESRTERIPIANSTCASLLKRTNLYVVTFEVVSMCEKVLRVEFSTKVKYSWVASQRLPVETSVKPHTIMFLVTFIKVVDFNEDIQPNIIIKT